MTRSDISRQKIQDKTRQAHNQTRQGKTRQDTTRHDMTWQDKKWQMASQDKTQTNARQIPRQRERQNLTKTSQRKCKDQGKDKTKQTRQDKTPAKDQTRPDKDKTKQHKTTQLNTIQYNTTHQKKRQAYIMNLELHTNDKTKDRSSW